MSRLRKSFVTTQNNFVTTRNKNTKKGCHGKNNFTEKDDFVMAQKIKYFCHENYNKNLSRMKVVWSLQVWVAVLIGRVSCDVELVQSLLVKIAQLTHVEEVHVSIKESIGTVCLYFC